MEEKIHYNLLLELLARFADDKAKEQREDIKAVMESVLKERDEKFN